jgi:hypothetical protein
MGVTLKAPLLDPNSERGYRRQYSGLGLPAEAQPINDWKARGAFRGMIADVRQRLPGTS